VRRLVSLYGASPLHLLALVACFALAGYAARELFSSEPVWVLVWFVGAAVGHDILLLPLYAIVDTALVRAGRQQRAAAETTNQVPWINYLRFPAAISGLLLIVFFPSIFRLASSYSVTTRLSPDSYVQSWLLVTGVLFAVSAVAYAVRLRRTRQAA